MYVRAYEAPLAHTRMDPLKMAGGRAEKVWGALQVSLNPTHEKKQSFQTGQNGQEF